MLSYTCHRYSYWGWSYNLLSKWNTFKHKGRHLWGNRLKLRQFQAIIGKKVFSKFPTYGLMTFLQPKEKCSKIISGFSDRICMLVKWWFWNIFKVNKYEIHLFMVSFKNNKKIILKKKLVLKQKHLKTVAWKCIYY